MGLFGRAVVKEAELARLRESDARLEETINDVQELRRWIVSYAGRFGLGGALRDVAAYEREEVSYNAWKIYRENPMAAAYVNNMLYFMARPGLKIYHNDAAADEEIQAFIESDYYYDTLKEFIIRGFLDGEIFPVCFANTLTGDMRVREVDPLEVKEVITAADDYREIEALYREYTRREYSYESHAWQTRLEKEFIRRDERVEGEAYTLRTFFMWKRPTLSSSTRGLSYLAPCLWDLTQYKELKRNRINLNRARTAFVYDVTVEGTPEEVEAERARINDEGAPTPGSIRVHNDKVKWEAKSPNIGAGDAKDDVRELGLQMGAALSMPEFLIRGDASNANYASTDTTYQAFKITVEAQEGFHTDNQIELFRWFLTQKARARRVSEEAAREPVNVVWPDLPEDQKTFNEMLNAALANDAISLDTYRQYLPIPIDSEAEEEKVAAEREKRIEQMGGLPFTHPAVPAEEETEEETEEAMAPSDFPASTGGLGRMGRDAQGAGGFCVCPKCGYKVPHTTAQPCDETKCPKCGATMARAKEEVTA